MNPVIMTNADYHASPALSKSDLDLIAKSPAHFIAAKGIHREQTPALLLGSVVHKLVLEPEDFVNEYIIAPECDKRTKEGKQRWSEFLEQAESLTVIEQALYDNAAEIAAAVKAHPVAAKLLQGGRAELSYFWERDGIECKCRPDYLREDIKTVVDFKTARCAAENEFTKAAYDYRYYVQAAWYLDGLRACGLDVENFIFVVVETAPPFPVMCYSADELMIKLGRQVSDANFAAYKEALESDNWRGYEATPQIHSLSLPDWVARKYF